MKDNAIKWLTELNPFDKVKGHTKIELTDVKTGKKQVIEKDNAFQAGVLAKYMRSMGAYNNNPYANSTWAGQPIWRNLCGGIFCFEDTIDNSQDEVEYMPAGNTMVANGAYMVNNAGTPIELGSYNEVESSTSGNDSVTFVYDWMTHQGNGTISCVCLTTEIGGYIGYGNKSGVAASGKKSLFTNQSSSGWVGGVYNNARYVINGINTTNKTINVTKYPAEITKGSIFDNIAEDTYTITYTGNNPSFGQCPGEPVHLGNGKFAILFLAGGDFAQWNNGATIAALMIVDVVNNTAEMISVTNTTGEEIRCSLNIGGTAVDEKYIYGEGGYGSNCYAIDYITSGNPSMLICSTSTQDQHPGYKGGAIMPDRSYLFGTMFDRVANTKYPTNGSYPSWARYNPDTDTLAVIHHSGWNYAATGMYKNPLLLATINNLETPVTKTAAQTMKITYTLSKASE